MRKNLKLWEVQNNLKGVQVAKKLEVSYAHYSAIKGGSKNPSNKLLEKFNEEFSDTKGADNIFELFKNE